MKAVAEKKNSPSSPHAGKLARVGAHTTPAETDICVCVNILPLLSRSLSAGVTNKTSVHCNSLSLDITPLGQLWLSFIASGHSQGKKKTNETPR